jgi:hypothetical protein
MAPSVGGRAMLKRESGCLLIRSHWTGPVMARSEANNNAPGRVRE